MILGATLAVPAPIAAQLDAQRATPGVRIDDGFDELVKYLRPAPRAEQDIDWRATFGAAIREASQQKKPVLLWAMNGHPLGCT